MKIRHKKTGATYQSDNMRAVVKRSVMGHDYIMYEDESSINWADEQHPAPVVFSGNEWGEVEDDNTTGLANNIYDSVEAAAYNSGAILELLHTMSNSIIGYLNTISHK